MNPGGTPRALRKPVPGAIPIQSNQAKELKAWSLDVVGPQNREMPLEGQDGAVQLKLIPEYETVSYGFSSE